MFCFVLEAKIIENNIQISMTKTRVLLAPIGKAFFIRSIINTKKSNSCIMYSIHCIHIVFSISFYAYITSVQSGNSVLEL